MKRRKAYKIPPPNKGSGKPPSEIGINNLEKELRKYAGGAYYEVYPAKDPPERKSWWDKNRPGIVMRYGPKFKEIKETFFSYPRHKKTP